MTDIVRELTEAITGHTWARDEVPTLLKRAVREINTLRHSLATEMTNHERAKGNLVEMLRTAEKYNRAALYAFSQWPDGHVDYEGWTWATGAASGAKLPPVAGEVKSVLGDVISRKADQGHDLADEQGRRLDLLDD